MSTTLTCLSLFAGGGGSDLGAKAAGFLPIGAVEFDADIAQCYADNLGNRFWSKVSRNGNCWEWQANKDPKGYGRFHIGPKVHGAHRVAWILTHGDIREGLCVLHRCDNPSCVNPAHLFLGTVGDNNRDMCAKGRYRGGWRNINGKWRCGDTRPHARGSALPQAILTEDSVRSIRSRYKSGGVTQQSLASEFGVKQTVISKVITGKSWAHVAETTP